jgi:putative DNA primase/helicase
MSDTDENIIRLAAAQERANAAKAAPGGDEDSLALDLAERHCDHLRYVAAWGTWMAFDGERWAPDPTLHVFDLVRALCRERAGQCNKPALKAAHTVAAVEKLARSDRRLAATVEQWDADPWLLCTGAVTIDLRTGEGHNTDPLDYCTKRTGCALAPPGTLAPRWFAFLDRVTAGDKALQGFLQRYLGYALTGLTREHVFAFAYGTGANGKTTFVKTLMRVFGDYATAAAMETFIATSTPQHPTDLAKLRGARLVTAQETKRGRKWDEPKIKAITGGDIITARFMRQDFFDFTPVCKLLISGNDKPRLDDVDEGMRRRLLIVPFTVHIPKEQQDKELVERLEAEHPAILRWCVEGCLAWQRDGLDPPERVVEATKAYFADQDTLEQWIQECALLKQSATATQVELFRSWSAWCEKRGMKPGTAIALGRALEKRDGIGLAPREGGSGRKAFAGIQLKNEEI